MRTTVAEQFLDAASSAALGVKVEIAGRGGRDAIVKQPVNSVLVTWQ